MIQKPKIGLTQFWQLVRESQLVSASDITRLLKESTALNHDDSEELAKWLVAEKILTPLQSEVLQAGHHGPFEFGRYRVLGRAPGENTFAARDRKTLHPVWLHFFAGDSQLALESWEEIEMRVEQFASISHPNLLDVYESLVTRTHRFVATSAAGTQSLAEKMPVKRRITEDQALKLVREVALPIAEIEKAGASHGSLSMNHVFHNGKAGITKVMPPLFEDTSESDVGALGRLLYRLVTGRDAPDGKRIAKAGLDKFSDSLTSRKISVQVTKLIYGALTAPDSFTTSDFIQRVEKIAGESFEDEEKSAPARELKFLECLSPAWETEQEPLADDESIPDVNYATERKPVAVSPKKRMPVAVSLGLSLLGFAACLGIVALLANLIKLDPPKPVVAKSDSETIEAIPEMDAMTAAKAKRERLKNLLASQSYYQELIADDRQSLWESPTTGFPIDVSLTPSSPRIIAAVNWASIYSSENGQRTLQALGPNLNAELNELESKAGFALNSMQSMVISLHTNELYEYDVCSVVKLQDPSPEATCLENWGQPTPSPGLEGVFDKATGTSWWIAKSNEDGVDTFLVGPTELVQQAARGEVAVLSGTLRNLVASSDADRDLNLIVPTISIFNTEGQKLFTDRQKWLNELRIALPQPVRGLLVSLHGDTGDYVEIRVDHTTELSSRETANTMRIRMIEKLEQLQLSIQQRQALPYWESLRSRYGAMLRELTDQLRWDSEFGSVVGNAWLPPGAMHNLFAATELAMAFEPGLAVVADAGKPKMPQNLEELLQTRRDLTIANPPDLNVLLKNIREEVSDQYLEMPFEFNIEMAGTDLQKEGITQNQRPGPLRITDKSLADILTQVMVSANPNRDITGPADPNCKLVWVVFTNPDTDKKSILITTRAAAIENGYKLPSAFIVEPE